MRARRLVGLLAVVALAMAGCGDGDSPGEPAQPQSPAPAVATPTAPAGAPTEIAGLTASYHGTEDITGTQEITIEMADHYFAPTVLRGAPGQELTVTLRNNSESPHHFTTADEQLIVEVQPGLTAEGQITLPRSGNLSFFCLLHGEDGMAGGFNVSGPVDAPDPHASPTGW